MRLLALVHPSRSVDCAESRILESCPSPPTSQRSNSASARLATMRSSPRQQSFFTTLGEFCSQAPQIGSSSTRSRLLGALSCSSTSELTILPSQGRQLQPRTRLLRAPRRRSSSPHQPLFRLTLRRRLLLCLLRLGRRCMARTWRSSRGGHGGPFARSRDGICEIQVGYRGVVQNC